MRVNQISNNNVNFNGFFSLFRAKKVKKEADVIVKKTAEETQRLAQKAEERLQSRLVSYTDLMVDFDTGKLKVMKTGEDFTGKFVIPVPDGKFERLFHSKNGQPQASLVRLKGTNKKQWAIRKRQGKDIAKEFFQTGLSKSEEKTETAKMIVAGREASERMHDNYVIQALMNSDKDCIVLQTKY